MIILAMKALIREDVADSVRPLEILFMHDQESFGLPNTDFVLQQTGRLICGKMFSVMNELKVACQS